MITIHYHTIKFNHINEWPSAAVTQAAKQWEEPLKVEVTSQIYNPQLDSVMSAFHMQSAGGKAGFKATLTIQRP